MNRRTDLIEKALTFLAIVMLMGTSLFLGFVFWASWLVTR